MYKVILDTMGGDNSPFAQVEGAVIAINEDKDLHVVLVGDEKVLNEELCKYNYNINQISIINATDVITNDDTPTVAIKQKTERRYFYVKAQNASVHPARAHTRRHGIVRKQGRRNGHRHHSVDGYHQFPSRQNLRFRPSRALLLRNNQKEP